MADRKSQIEVAEKGFAGAEYNHVAMGSKLRLISLAKNAFNVNPDCLANQDDWKLTYDHSVVACSYSSNKSVASAIFQYEIVAKHSRKTAMRCIAEYVVLYSVPADSVPEAAEGFCKNVGRYAAYPYFRALVAQLVAGANLILPPLPTIASTAHIPKKVEKDVE